MAVKRNNQPRGIALVELLIVMAIITTALAYLFGVMNFSLKKSYEQESFAQALWLGQETMEQLRIFRDSTTWQADGLGAVTNDISYHLELSPQISLAVGTKTDQILGLVFFCFAPGYDVCSFERAGSATNSAAVPRFD